MVTSGTVSTPFIIESIVILLIVSPSLHSERPKGFAIPGGILPGSNLVSVHVIQDLSIAHRVLDYRLCRVQFSLQSLHIFTQVMNIRHQVFLSMA